MVWNGHDVGAGTSTWAMMALGFAALGYAAFRRNTKARRTAPLGEAAV